MSGRSRRIGAAFERARAAGRAAIIPYLAFGDPGPAESVELIAEAAASGADLVEIGLPFSDPLADGPVIQAASQRALEAGATPAGALEAVREIRRQTDVPLVFMGYYNPLLRFGLTRFFEAMREAGADGMIVPDLPLEESDDLRQAAGAAGISYIPLIAPTSSDVRLRKLDAAAGDFLYGVSVTGVTGARDRLDDALPEYLARVERAVTHPFVVGFGISRPEQIARLAPPAAGVVVGSALIRAMCGGADRAGRRQAVRQFVSSFVAAAGGAATGAER